MPLSPPASRNTLLSALSANDYALIERHLTRVPLPLRLSLQNAGKMIEWVYFPEDGLGLVVATESNGKQVEVGIFGKEGMSATAVVLGADRSPHDVFMQIQGVSGLRIAAKDLRDAMAASRSLHGLLLRYVQSMMIQSASSTSAAAGYMIGQRLARLLLMCHDRVAGDDINLTHEFMSMMLGSRRAGVTNALQALEERCLVTVKRGCVLIGDRSGLERFAGSNYGIAEGEYERLLKVPVQGVWPNGSSTKADSTLTDI